VAAITARANVTLPTTLAEVILITEQTEGVRLGELLATLQPDTRLVEEALAQILRDALNG
jgi:hypothetical protein